MYTYHRLASSVVALYISESALLDDSKAGRNPSLIEPILFHKTPANNCQSTQKANCYKV